MSPNEFQKARLETIIFASGLVGGFASSTGYFLGNAKEEWGPVFTFLITLVWLIFFFYVLLRRRKTVPGPSPIYRSLKIRVSGKKKAYHSFSWLDTAWILMFPWFITTAIWAVGVYQHEMQPEYIFISGYAQYSGEDSLNVGVRAVDGVKVAVMYANRTSETLTDPKGYFQISMDIDPQYRILNISYAKKNHRSVKRSFDIKGKTELDADIFLQTQFQP